MPTRVMDIDLLRPLPEVAPLRAQEGFLGLVRAGPALVGRLCADAAQAGQVTRDLAAHLPRAVSPERFAEACRAAGVPERLPADLGFREVQEIFRREASRPPEKAPPVLVSVVLCTRHRREHLIRCLESLLHLTGVETELILVDNNDTNEGVFDLAGRFPCRYVKCLKPGLSRSRNRGVAEARGEIVAFTHDDAEVDPGWVHGLLKTFADGAVHAAVGPVVPRELITRGQEWFDALGWTHPCWYRGRTLDGEVMPGAGANMAVRREVLKSLGGFDELLGAGTPTGGGEDSELLGRVGRAGGRVVYTPEALVRHRHRIDMDGARAAAFQRATGRTAALARQAHREGRYGAAARELGRCLVGPGEPGDVTLDRPRSALAMPVRALAALYGPVTYLQSLWAAGSEEDE